MNLGTKINLPMLAAGDALYLQGTYTQGATTYVLANPMGWGSGGFSAGQLSIVVPDAVIVGTPAKNTTSLINVWGLTAGLLHYWTPTIRQGLFGSYIQVDVPGAAYNAAGGNVPANTFRDANYWTVGSNVIWSPVKGLDIGAELNYLAVDTSGGKIVSGSSKGNLLSESNAIIGRLRIQRDF